jgi:hypothetical protein
MVRPDLPEDYVPPKWLRFFGDRESYWVISVSLILFNWAEAMFAITPLLPEPNPLLLVEVVIAATAAISNVGIVLHLLGNRSLLARTGYLISIYNAALTILGFSLGEVAADAYLRLTVFLFLSGTILLAAGMHIAHGGRRHDD